MLTQLCADAEVPAQSGFALSDDGGAWRFHGTLTFDNVTAVYEAAQAMALPTQGVVDLAGLIHADSSALAVLLGLTRRAMAEGRPLAWAGLPEPLRALARVYGIEELIEPVAGVASGAGD